MSSLVAICSEIESRYPSAFSMKVRRPKEFLPTGIAELDALTGGVPLHCLTEVCGSSIASSGKTSILVSLMAQTTQQGKFCALVDGKDSFDPISAAAAGVDLSRVRWIRCSTTEQTLKPWVQVIKATDGLLRNGGFSVIAVDLSRLTEQSVRRITMNDWFRFSKVVENQPTALVFLEQHPHATSCAGLVLKCATESATLSGKIFTKFNFKAEVIRTREKKHVQSTAHFSIKTQWA